MNFLKTHFYRPALKPHRVPGSPNLHLRHCPIANYAYVVTDTTSTCTASH